MSEELLSSQPLEEVCIKTKKVYEECKILESDDGRAFEVTVQGINVPDGAVDCECRILHPTIVSLGQCDAPPNLDPPLGLGGCPEDRHGKHGLRTGCCWQIPGPPGPPPVLGIVEVCQPDIRMLIEVRFFDAGGTPIGGPQLGTAIFTALADRGKQAIRLLRAGEPRMQCEVDIFLDSIACFIEDDDEVVCCINVVKVIKLFAEVQLLIPAFGFCPQPPECELPPLGECPEAEQTWPPFPPQLDNQVMARAREKICKKC